MSNPSREKRAILAASRRFNMHRLVAEAFKYGRDVSLGLQTTRPIPQQSHLYSSFKMLSTVASLFVTALAASATIIAPPSIPRALGDVIILQPPQGYVVRAGEAFALHYISRPSDDFVTYETEVGLQRAGRHNIRGIKQFHPTTDVIKESVTIPHHIAPGRYNLIVTDHRTTFDKDVADNQALPSYRNQALNVTITVAHADPYLKDLKDL